MANFSISDIAQRANVETSTIRYYERIGLLPRAKRINTRRVYDEDVLKRLVLIKATKAAGFTIAEIQTLMMQWQTEGRSPKAWRQFVEQKLVAIDTLITEALHTKKILSSALACGCLDDYTVSLDSFIASTSLDDPDAQLLKKTQ